MAHLAFARVVVRRATHPAEGLGGEGCHEVTAWAIRLSCEFDGGDVLRSKPLNVLQVDADHGCCDVGRG